jgi:hypothetical protein
MVKNGGKVKWERLCRFLAVYLGVFKTLSQAGTARHAEVTYRFWKPWSCTFTGKKSSLAQAGPAEEIAFEIEEFSPTGQFLYWNTAFWQKNSAKFQRNFLATLKIAPDQKTWNPR